MNVANLKKSCWALIATLVASNIIWVVVLYWKESNWNLKYGTDLREASGLLVHYDRTFRDHGAWPKDAGHWAGISSLYLVSTNVVDGREVHVFKSDWGGDHIEIHEASDGSPFLSLESYEEDR